MPVSLPMTDGSSSVSHSLLVKSMTQRAHTAGESAQDIKHIVILLNQAKFSTIIQRRKKHISSQIPFLNYS